MVDFLSDDGRGTRATNALWKPGTTSVEVSVKLGPSRWICREFVDIVQGTQSDSMQSPLRPQGKGKTGTQGNLGQTVFAFLPASCLDSPHQTQLLPRVKILGCNADSGENQSVAVDTVEAGPEDESWPNTKAASLMVCSWIGCMRCDAMGQGTIERRMVEDSKLGTRSLSGALVECE